MSNPEQSTAGIRSVDELIDRFDTAMLVTEALDGELRGRPMMIAEHRSGGYLWFATPATGQKLEEVLNKPQVAVIMQSGGRYLSLSGEARLETEDGRLDELWSPAWKLWFPEGVEDPDLCLIRIEPQKAEYWDQPGAERVELLWKAGKALFGGQNEADAQLGEHDKVDLQRSG